MGLFRKLASTVTVGAIDFRSDKERTAMYARQTRNAIERQQQRAEWAEQTHRIAEAGDAARAAWEPKIQELKQRSAAANDLLSRIRSTDEAVRAAALEEWRREHSKQG